MKRYALFLPALLVLVLDQLTKAWVLATLAEGESVPVVGEILRFTHVHNPGTAFGLLRGSGTLLTFVSIGAVFFITGYWFHLLRKGERVSPALLGGLSLPLGGALGNLVDRIRLGHVTDFIDFRVWPVFNIADMAITGGAALIAYYFLVVQGGEPEAGVQGEQVQGSKFKVQGPEIGNLSPTPNTQHPTPNAPPEHLNT